MNLIELYTDGACLGNPGPGGFAWILRWNNHEKTYQKGFRYTTNNRMELMAVIDGLTAVRKKEWPVIIYTDSQYITRAIHQNWLMQWIEKKFQKTANADLWKRFLQHYRPDLHTFQWIKGHAGNPFNHRCDEMAVWAARHSATNEDTGFLISKLGKCSGKQD